MDIHNLTDEEKILQRDLHIRRDFPLPYTISLGAYSCNRSCRMCPMYNAPPPKKAELYITTEIFSKALGDIGGRKVDLELSAYGEPTLHPQFDDFLVLARNLCPNAHIVVNTNGVLLDRKRCESIVDSGIDQLVFSLNAGSPSTYKWLTGGDDYDLVCRNLEALVEIRNKKNAKHLTIQTHIIGIKELEHEFESFLARWKNIVDLPYVRLYGNWAGLVDCNGISPATRQKIPNERYPCGWLWYATKIEPNGDVSKCFVHVVGDKEPVGNIMLNHFLDIWHGDRVNSIRRAHLEERWDELEFCKNCIVWSLFPKFWERLTPTEWREP